MPDLPARPRPSLPPLPRLDPAAVGELHAAVRRARSATAAVLAERAARWPVLEGWVGPHRRTHDHEEAALRAAGRDLDEALRSLDLRLDAAVGELLSRRRAARAARAAAAAPRVGAPS